MGELISAFERDGCAVVPSVVTEQQLELATAYCDSIELSGAGSRDLLKLPWCADIARSLRFVTAISTLMGESRTAVQCTLFVKDPHRNWLVPLHRDLVVRSDVETRCRAALGAAGYRTASRKGWGVDPDAAVALARATG